LCPLNNAESLAQSKKDLGPAFPLLGSPPTANSSHIAVRAVSTLCPLPKISQNLREVLQNSYSVASCGNRFLIPRLSPLRRGSFLLPRQPTYGYGKYSRRYAGSRQDGLLPREREPESLGRRGLSLAVNKCALPRGKNQGIRSVASKYWFMARLWEVLEAKPHGAICIMPPHMHSRTLWAPCMFFCRVLGWQWVMLPPDIVTVTKHREPVGIKSPAATIVFIRIPAVAGPQKNSPARVTNDTESVNPK